MKSNNEKIVAIIPARLESSRLPRKALANILGLPMIIHVLKRCLIANSVDDVYVATDSDEIRSVVESYNGRVIMTSSLHQTGTDRIAEAAEKIDAEIIVNVQGDEALVNPQYIDKVVYELCENPDINVGILVNKFNKRGSISDIKVVLNEHNDVLYFSRSDIPSNARLNNAQMLKAYHIVPFRKSFLIKYANWGKGELEQIESNEYLRIIEKGHSIKAVHVDSDAVSVDTIEDLEYVREKMKTDPWFVKYSKLIQQDNVK